MVYVINDLVITLSVTWSRNFHFGELVKISNLILAALVTNQLCICYIYRFRYMFSWPLRAPESVLNVLDFTLET